MRILTFLFFIGLCLTMSAQKLYSTRTMSQADIKVLVVDKEYRADIIVYKTNKESRAKSTENKGIWFFCENPSRADKKIYFVDKEYQADLKVFFTDKEYRAGWKNETKKHLLF